MTYPQVNDIPAQYTKEKWNAQISPLLNALRTAPANIASLQANYAALQASMQAYLDSKKWVNAYRFLLKPVDDYYVAYTDANEEFMQDDDASAIINACRAVVDEEAKGGTIMLRTGQYHCNSPIIGGNSFCIDGEAMGPWEDFSVGTVLNYYGTSTNPFLDYRDCHNVRLRNFKMKNFGSSNVGFRTGGSTPGNPNSTRWLDVQNFSIWGFPTGVLGDVHGSDDSNYYNLFVGGATDVAIDHLNSQTKLFGGAVYSSPNAIGFRITRDAPTPDSSTAFYSFVFSSVKIGIDVTGSQYVRGITGYNLWFEVVGQSLMRLTENTSNEYIGDFRFYNSYGFPNAGAKVFELAGKWCTVSWEGGEIYPANSPCNIETGNGGLGHVYQRLRIRPTLGIERIAYTDYSSIRGFDATTCSLLDQPQGYEPLLSEGTDWVPVCSDYVIPWHPYQHSRIRLLVTWTPGSANAGFRLDYPVGTVVTGSLIEPTTADYRTDIVDITAAANILDEGNLVISCHGDGAIAPKFYRIVIMEEF
jgi:hypothetical protein